MKSPIVKFTILIGACALSLLVGYHLGTKSVSMGLSEAADRNAFAHVFDASVALPGTKVSVQYPSSGFYGHGADITTDNVDGVTSVHIEPEDGYIADASAEFVVFNLSATTTDVDTLDAVIDTRQFGDIEKSYVEANGRFIAVNGQRYFTYVVREDHTAIAAITLLDGHVFTALLAYTETDGKASQAAASNNESLLREILTNLAY